MASEVTAILDDLRRIVRVLRESSRAAEQQLGVSGAQLFVMRALSSSPALSLNMLAARTRTHQSTASVVVTRLVERGLVRRRMSEHDGRRIELELTPRGRKLLERAPFAAQDRLIEGVEKLSPEQRRDLAHSMHQLVLAMQLGDEPPSMFFDESDEPDSLAPKPKRARSRSKEQRSDG
ncbi:MAG TPA: MarR family winged helix-turn-helix transcriptional regulator [Polyangiales bacterium]|jgi:DNA-binding MarR family transcriptional regulator|nr:MarR family winged helix-turn-helix transcriptional regulator [Polyangiales bacterium]